MVKVVIQGEDILRRLLNLATVLSLLLWIACPLLFVRSVYRVDELIVTFGDADLVFYSFAGAFSLIYEGSPPGPPLPTISRLTDIGPNAWDELRWLPTYRHQDQNRWFGAEHLLRIPYWMIWLASALLPALWLWRRRQKSRREFPVQSAVKKNSN